MATASLGGLAVWLALRKRGKKEKGSPLGQYHFNPLTALKDEPRPSSSPEKSYHFNPVHSLQTSPPLPSKQPLSSPLIDPAINERVKALNQKRDIRLHQSKQKAPLPSVNPMTTKPSVQPMRSYHFNGRFELIKATDLRVSFPITDEDRRYTDEVIETLTKELLPETKMPVFNLQWLYDMTLAKEYGERE